MTTAEHEATLEHAWDVLETVPDPEIPVVSIRELGILRDVRRAADDTLEIVITPTYSGCPAMYQIAEDIGAALNDAGFRSHRIETVLAPAWTTDWMTDDAREKLRHTASRRPWATAAQTNTRRKNGRCASCRASSINPPARAAVQRIQSASPNSARPRARRCIDAWIAANRSTTSNRTETDHGDSAIPFAAHPRRPSQNRQRCHGLLRSPRHCATRPLHARPVRNVENAYRRRGNAPLVFDLRRRDGLRPRWRMPIGIKRVRGGRFSNFAFDTSSPATQSKS